MSVSRMSTGGYPIGDCTCGTRLMDEFRQLLHDTDCEQERLRPRPPHRRLMLRLRMEADTLDALYDGLTALAHDLLLDGREDRETTSGGVSSGYHLQLSVNPEMDHDRYVEVLTAWRSDRSKRSSQGVGDG